MQLRAFRDNPLIHPSAHSAQRSWPRMPRAAASLATASCGRSSSGARPYHRAAADGSSPHRFSAGLTARHQVSSAARSCHRSSTGVRAWAWFSTGVRLWQRFSTGVCFCGSPIRNRIAAPAPHRGRANSPAAQLSSAILAPLVSNPPVPIGFDRREATRSPRRRVRRSCVTPVPGSFAGARPR